MRLRFAVAVVFCTIIAKNVKFLFTPLRFTVAVVVAVAVEIFNLTLDSGSILIGKPLTNDNPAT